LIIALLLLAGAAASSSETSILAQLSAGKMLCSNPDPATKTCSAISSYVHGENDSFVETSEILLPAPQPLTLQLSAAARIKGSTICGIMSEADLQKGLVRVNGSLLQPEQNARAMGTLIEKLRPMAGRQACEELRIEGGVLMKYGQVEQVDLKLPGKPVRWISTADGYTVSPR